MTSAPSLPEAIPCSSLDRWHTRQTDTAALALHALICDGPRQVAVGDGGTILISDDGLGWTPASSGTNAALLGVVYGGGQYAAVGGGGVLLRSSDAMAWTASVSPTNRTLDERRLGRRPLRGRRADRRHADLQQRRRLGHRGLSNQPQPSLRPLAEKSVSHYGQCRLPFHFADGLTWSHRSFGTLLAAYDVAWGAGRYLAVGSSGLILTSSNSVDWTAQTSPYAGRLRRVLWAENRFVAAGDDGVVLSSPDGITWTRHNSRTALPLEGLSQCGSTICIAGAHRSNLPDQLLWPTDNPCRAPGRRRADAQLRGEVGAIYQWQSSTNLHDWLSGPTVTNMLQATDGPVQPFTNAPRQFHRVVTPP